MLRAGGEGRPTFSAILDQVRGGSQSGDVYARWGQGSQARSGVRDEGHRDGGPPGKYVRGSAAKPSRLRHARRPARPMLSSSRDEPGSGTVFVVSSVLVNRKVSNVHAPVDVGGSVAL